MTLTYLDHMRIIRQIRQHKRFTVWKSIRKMWWLCVIRDEEKDLFVHIAWHGDERKLLWFFSPFFGIVYLFTFLHFYTSLRKRWFFLCSYCEAHMSCALFRFISQVGDLKSEEYFIWHFSMSLKLCVTVFALIWFFNNFCEQFRKNLSLL